MGDYYGNRYFEPSRSRDAYYGPSGGYVQKVQKKHPRAYTPWTYNDERTLRVMHDLKYPVSLMAEKLERQESGITSRLDKLGLEVLGPEPQKCYVVLRANSVGELVVVGRAANRGSIEKLIKQSIKNVATYLNKKLYLVESSSDPAVAIQMYEIVSQESWSLRKVN